MAQEAFLRLARTDLAGDRRRPRLADRRGGPAVSRSTAFGAGAAGDDAAARARLGGRRRCRRSDPADRVTLDDEVEHRAARGAAVSSARGSAWRSSCTTCSRCRSTRSPRPSAGRWARAVSSRGGPGEVRRRGARARRGDAGRTSARHRGVHHRLRQRRPRGADVAAGPDGVGGRHGARRSRAAATGQPRARTTSPSTCCVTWVRGRPSSCGPPGEPVLLAFDRGRLFAVVVLTIRDGLVVKIEATADPSARQP